MRIFEVQTCGRETVQFAVSSQFWQFRVDDSLARIGVYGTFVAKRRFPNGGNFNGRGERQLGLEHQKIVGESAIQRLIGRS